MNHLASQRASLPVLGILESHPLGLKASPNTADRVVVVVQLLSRVWLFVTPWTAARQAPYPPPSPRVCSNLCPLSRWCAITISSSAAPFSFCLQSFPASGSFPVSRLFAASGQSIGASLVRFISGYLFFLIRCKMELFYCFRLLIIHY